MARIFLRPKAVDDLTGIWDYTVETWSIEQAERYVRLINRSFEELDENPDLGGACDALRKAYRKHLVGRHVVFYRAMDTGIDVVRVLHQSMDFERHL